MCPEIAQIGQETKAGRVADKLLLPDAGVPGNSHMMMNQNSGQAAKLTQQWLARQGVMKWY